MSTDDRPTPVAAAAPDDDGAAVLDDALARLATAADNLAAVEVAGLSGERVADAVARLAAVGGRLEGISARFVAAAEAAGVPGAAGAPSTTSWLARVTGRNRGQAARGAKLARAVVDAPELGDALSQGDVGPDQAASIASALDRGVLTPNDTGQLLADASVLDPTQFARQTRQRDGLP